MQSWHNIRNVEADELLGEWHPLVDQLVSTEGLIPLSSVSNVLKVPRITNLSSLKSFLESYRAQILIPLELPAIMRAFLHVTRQQTRELIGYDQQLAQEPILKDFQRASQRIGKFQLQRLRPLRDHRPLQRYLRAVEENRAYGWHTLVFGLTLSVYSLPVRQGLVFYERQTLQGFLYAAARSLHLGMQDCRLILKDLCADLPPDLESLNPSREWVATSPAR